MDASVLGCIRSHFGRLKQPSTRDKVYKDECLLSFDSPFSDNGLYVNLVTWNGFGQDYFMQDSAKTGCRLYLHEKWDQVPKEKQVGAAEAPSELAIGTAGGFMTESKFDLIKTHALVVVNGSADGSTCRVDLPNEEIPEFVSNIIQAIIDHDGMKSKMQLDTWSADQEIFESKYARTLPQLDTGKKILQDPTTWACEASGAKDNLWLNLSTGYIGGGRKNWDGSGGSGAALQHFIDTGKQFPLCVKLGTITAHGGDVWSYADDEDCLVKNPLLAQHLRHWGIDIMGLEKTDKTMGELEVDLNMSYDWSKILESGESLQPLAGPGLVGLRNIGSSCYMNSVMQTMFSVPEVATRYMAARASLLDSALADPTADLPAQMSKLAHALLTDKYVDPEAVRAAAAAAAAAGEPGVHVHVSSGEAPPDATTLEKFVVAPRMFKQLVGKGHPEFSSGRQQCAGEYWEHLLEVLTAAERPALAVGRFGQEAVAAGAPTTAALFEFEMQTRDVCSVTGQVRYRNEKQCILPVS